jgi:hypothetical protein
MEELRRKHDAIMEEERAAEKEKEDRRKARAKAEREERDRASAERAQACSSTPSSSNTPAPWGQGMPITGVPDAAALARQEAEKAAFIERQAEHCARRRQQEKKRIEEEMRKSSFLELSWQLHNCD